MPIPMIIDVDGVMTNGTVLYTSMERSFNLRDGHGFQLLQNKTNIIPWIMSGENNDSIKTRGEKLNVLCGTGIKDKYQHISDLGYYHTYIAISDDVPDLELLQNATLAFCPADAEDEIKSIDGIIVLTKKGGEGCVREAVNMILTQPWIKDLFRGALQIT